MHHLGQTFLKTKKYKRCMIVIFLSFLEPQCLFSLDDPTITVSLDQITADSAFAAKSAKDSIFHSSVLKLDSNYKPRSIHPYFRDSYRVIQDIRRLVRLFDYRVVNDYESMSDLLDICRKFPEQKQTKIIGTAMAGGFVNLISEETNKQLRKKKINFVQWRLEKVILQSRCKNFSLNFHTGISSRGVGVYFPALQIHYYYYSTQNFRSESINFCPIRKLGLNFARWNGHAIMTPYFYSSIGTIALSFDKDNKIIRSRVDIRKSPSLIIRIIHISYLKQINSNRLMSEVLICW